MITLNNIIDDLLNKNHTDNGYIVRTGGHVKFFVDYDKAVSYFQSCCVNPEFGSMISRSGYIPNIRCEYHCMGSCSGVTTVEMRTVDEVDLEGTPKTWKSFNETMEDIRKEINPVVKDLLKILGSKTTEEEKEKK